MNRDSRTTDAMHRSEEKATISRKGIRLHRVQIGMMIVAFAFAFLVTVENTLSARDYYVNNELGDDRSGGNSADFDRGTGPFKTIARALKAAGTGDRIIIAKTSTPYRESITLQGGKHSGSALSPVIIEGNGAVLDGSQPIDPEAWEHVAGNLFKAKLDRIKYQILFKDSIPAKKIELGSPDDLAALKPFEYAIFEGELYFMVEKDKLPDSYDLSCCGEKVGITLYQVNHVAIFSLTIQGFQLDGINCHDLARNVKVFDCTLRGNGRSGISTGGASRLLLGTSVIGNNGKSQVRSEGYSKVDIQECDLIKAESANRISVKGGARVKFESDTLTDHLK